MFKEGVDYKKIINSYIYDDIDANKDLYFTDKNGFKGIDENQTFYLNKNGIVIYFSLYEIAPYYVGIPKFIIPYEDLEPYLNI
ncbi:MAG: RsiV family protein [Terrisporobacter sp.]|uniref:RsiV family protein n=1 Tax=Terrisporobacter sp. TaxID=1965305 RepID=UPI002FCC9F91